MNQIKIPFSELNFSFSRSSGAGGQNVNKVNTKATLEWDPSLSSACPPAVFERFRRRWPQYVLDDGRVQFSCQSSRSQKANIDECVKKLHEMLNAVARPPKLRKATRPTRSSIKKRLESKRKHSEKKSNRSKAHSRDTH